MIAAAAAIAGVALAARHPLAPTAAVAAVIGSASIAAAWPRLWWFVVPAFLPALDFSPWTGVTVFDEFDLLLFAMLAGAWSRAARDAPACGPEAPARGERILVSIVCLVGLSAAASLVRGLLDATGPWNGAFEGYADPLNGARVTKSVFFALLFAPLVRRGLRADRARVLGLLCRGMWAGLTIVALAVFAERAAFPGLVDFSQPYRTTALFWEMHVGGAAIDVYTVLGVPFVAWAVWSARSVAGRVASALLAVAWGYVCLTTFSRGVWLAALLALALLATAIRFARLERDVRWRRAGDLVLLLALLAEAGAVASTGTFMGERLTASDRDLSSRRVHWRAGLRLLKTSADWTLGIGAGRLPARYAAETPRHGFSGSAHAVAATSGGQPSFVTLTGPRGEPSLGGLFALTQRVALRPGVRFEADVSLRPHGDTRLAVLVCETHLLYFGRCQGTGLRLHAAPADAWQRLRLRLAGPSLDPGRWFAPRGGALVLSVGNAGGAVDVTDVELHAGTGASSIRNPRYADGLAGWFPLAQRYFLPWHIDNFALETLIERGVAGLLAAAALIAFGLVSMSRRWRVDPDPFAPFLGTAICAVLVVGMVSSVADAPRVAFAFWLLVIVAAQWRVAQLSTTEPTPSPAGAPIAASTPPAPGAAAIVPPPRNRPHVEPP